MFSKLVASGSGFAFSFPIKWAKFISKPELNPRQNERCAHELCNGGDKSFSSRLENSLCEGIHLPSPVRATLFQLGLLFAWALAYRQRRTWNLAHTRNYIIGMILNGVNFTKIVFLYALYARRLKSGQPIKSEMTRGSIETAPHPSAFFWMQFPSIRFHYVNSVFFNMCNCAA